MLDNQLSLSDDYTDMLKEADLLLDATEDVVKYLEIKREEYIE